MKGKLVFTSLLTIIVFLSFNLPVSASEPVNFYQPGNYPVRKYYIISLPRHDAVMAVTLDTIDITNDLELKLNFVWYLKINPGHSVKKRSDYGNAKMYLSDDLGNVYYMTNATDDAANDVSLENGEICSRSFFFSKLNEGVKKITFHDDDQNKTIIIE